MRSHKHASAMYTLAAWVTRMGPAILNRQPGLVTSAPAGSAPCAFEASFEAARVHDQELGMHGTVPRANQ
eukprot:2927113-Alexandrium_andersonii.AAC.1